MTDNIEIVRDRIADQLGVGWTAGDDFDNNVRHGQELPQDERTGVPRDCIFVVPTISPRPQSFVGGGRSTRFYDTYRIIIRGARYLWDKTYALAKQVREILAGCEFGPFYDVQVLNTLPRQIPDKKHEKFLIEATFFSNVEEETL